MYFRIAKEIGGMTVGEMLERMTMRELIEWGLMLQMWYPAGDDA